MPYRLALLGLMTTAMSCGKHDEDTGPTVPLDTGPDEIVYPQGDRILVYKGHGGVTGKDSGWGQIDDIDEHWKEKYGWNTDWRDTFGDDPTQYRLIVFMDPGAWGDASWTDDELDLLRGAMAQGTRMLVLTEQGDCNPSPVEELLEGLGAPMRFTGEGADEYSTREASYIATHQATEGVHDIYLSDPCFLDTNGSTYLMVDVDGNVLATVYRPGMGGDVVAVGDFEFLDDDPAGNNNDYLEFADRLAEVIPGYTAEEGE